MKIPRAQQPLAFMLLILIMILIEWGAAAQDHEHDHDQEQECAGNRAFFRPALKLANAEAFPAFFASLCSRVGHGVERGGDASS